MIFFSLIILIICKALINDKLSEDFYQRISAIVLLLSAILSFNCLFLSLDWKGGSSFDLEGLNYNIDFNSGIGIYNGLFHIGVTSHFLEIFLLIVGFTILISWPLKKDSIDEFIYTELSHTALQTEANLDKNSFLYNLVHILYKIFLIISSLSFLISLIELISIIFFTNSSIILSYTHLHLNLKNE